MRNLRYFSLLLVLVLLALGLIITSCGSTDITDSTPSGSTLPEIDAASIGGQVLNAEGSPEAGVWVIAETRDLPTHYRKIVVTNDDGKFVIPELPEANYEIWVRGYGLRDSRPVKATLGQTLELAAEQADSPQEAAKVYPANYWFSLYQPPSKNQIPENFVSVDHWLAQVQLGCNLCHQLGSEPTRKMTRPEEWDQAFKLAGVMNAYGTAFGRTAITQSLADWATRIKAGEVPPAPPRPAGVERNIVISQWEWGRRDSYIHDEIATDKRNPTLYPGGGVYGMDIGQDILWELNPKTHTVSEHKVPTRGGFDTPWADQPGFSTWKVYNNPANPHNPMMDSKGRVWMTSQIRDDKIIPEWAKDDPAINAGPSHRQLAMYDSNTGKMYTIDTAYGNHHLQFDANDVLWSSGDSYVLGKFDTKLWDPNDPSSEEKAQKWYELIDSVTGEKVYGFLYGIAVNPVDGTIWGASPTSDGVINRIIKFDPKTEKFTNYPLPAPLRGPRGIDFTTDGKVWTATGSGHVVSFDPKTEKFSYWEAPTPKFKGVGAETGVIDMYYYLWVDQFDTLGMGKDMVYATGANSDALVAFNPKTEQFNIIRVPYPLGMFTRGLDGRIDDPNAGWKGKGVWVAYGGDPIKFTEDTGIGYINKVQFRSDPLAN